MGNEGIIRQEVKGLDMMLNGLHMMGVVTHAQYRDWSLELHDGKMEEVMDEMVASMDSWVAQKKGKVERSVE